MKSRPVLFILFSLIACAVLTTSLSAKDTKKSDTKAKKPKTETFEDYRDPFWPLDWQPPGWGTGDDPEVISKMTDWKEAKKMISYKGGSGSKAKWWASIKIKGMKKTFLISAGDTISVKYGGRIYRWTVTEVTQNGFRTKKKNSTAL